MIRVLTICAFAAAACAAAAQENPQRAPLDGEIVVSGMHVGCTGVGQTKNDARWRAYPVRIEFADTNHAYLADEALTISDASGKALATVTCEGPWILLRPEAPGAYAFKGWFPSRAVAPRTGTFRVPGKGHARLVLTFPAE
jgi:hypothetical protein